MEQLKDFLENHEKQEYRRLIEMPLEKVTGLYGYRHVSDVAKDFNIQINGLYNEYSMTLMKKLGYSYWVIFLFNFLTTYIIFGAVGFMLVFPFVVAKYWLYFGLLLIPLAVFSMGLIKTTAHIIFGIIIVGLLIYVLVSGTYILFSIITPLWLLSFGLRSAKIFYRKSLIDLALNNELSFKFLFFIQILVLSNKITGERIISE